MTASVAKVALQTASPFVWPGFTPVPICALTLFLAAETVAWGRGVRANVAGVTTAAAAAAAASASSSSSSSSCVLLLTGLVVCYSCAAHFLVLRPATLVVSLLPFLLAMLLRRKLFVLQPACFPTRLPLVAVLAMVTMRVVAPLALPPLAPAMLTPASPSLRPLALLPATLVSTDVVVVVVVVVVVIVVVIVVVVDVIIVVASLWRCACVWHDSGQAAMSLQLPGCLPLLVLELLEKEHVLFNALLAHSRLKLFVQWLQRRLRQPLNTHGGTSISVGVAAFFPAAAHTVTLAIHTGTSTSASFSIPIKREVFASCPLHLLARLVVQRGLAAVVAPDIVSAVAMGKGPGTGSTGRGSRGPLCCSRC